MYEKNQKKKPPLNKLFRGGFKVPLEKNQKKKAPL